MELSIVLVTVDSFKNTTIYANNILDIAEGGLINTGYSAAEGVLRGSPSFIKVNN